MHIDTRGRPGLCISSLPIGRKSIDSPFAGGREVELDISRTFSPITNASKQLCRQSPSAGRATAGAGMRTVDRSTSSAKCSVRASSGRASTQPLIIAALPWELSGWRTSVKGSAVVASFMAEKASISPSGTHAPETIHCVNRLVVVINEKMTCLALRSVAAIFGDYVTALLNKEQHSVVISKSIFC